MNQAIHAPMTILRLVEVKARTRLARSTIYERIKSGEFPAQVSLGAYSDEDDRCFRLKMTGDSDRT